MGTPTRPVSWTSSRWRRAERTSGSSTTSKEDTRCIASRRKKPLTSSALSRRSRSDPKGFPISPPPTAVASDIRTPLIKAQDCIKVDIASGKITDYIKFESGNVCMVTGGRNLGRVGIIMHREKHPGSFDIVHVKDAAGHSFA